MDNTEALNRILSSACPSHTYSDGTVEFLVELHCVTAKVIATPGEQVFSGLDTDGSGLYAYTTYTIIDLEFT